MNRNYRTSIVFDIPEERCDRELEVAEAIRDALHMGQRERVARWQTMIGPLRKHDVSWWAAAFLKELANTPVIRHAVAHRPAP